MTGMIEYSSITHKAGDKAYYALQLPAGRLDTDTTYSARAHIVDISVSPHVKVDEFDCTVTPPEAEDEGHVVVIERSSVDTDADWPRPTNYRQVKKLFVDVEIFDTATPAYVESTSSFIIEVPFDATQP